ncbi:MAG TPA: acyl-CoA desaturase [Bacteroidia bacterium]|jgi:stearoyl-CoA desaturase (delta-9 desaturase)|nr:acyl-CoA desaturase [Bacteroidia bacterium]
MPILIFFLLHWFISLFCQTFFLHRYASHKMFSMSKGWEKFFYFLTFITQGSSFLNPRAYAILHRMHHTYSDTEKDPHSPHFFKDVWSMMIQTKNMYMDYATGKVEPEEAFKGNYPEWPALDKIADVWYTRLAFAAFYIAFYIAFAPSAWWFLLLPLEFVIGPLQGAVVNWCGHKYGYSNYDNGDKSKNSSPIDIFLLGELFLNNHHKSPNNPNFARKWFEFDPTYPVMRLLNTLHIIKLRRVPS